MKSRKLKPIALLLVFLLVASALSGCATTNDRWGNAKKGGIVGAIGGAAIGFLDNGIEGALIGAAVGAVAGGIIGGIIDHVQYKKAPEVVQQYGRVNKVAVEDINLSKNIFQNGETGQLEMKYVVINPDDLDKKNTVNQAIEIYQGDKLLASNENKQSVATGGYKATFPLEIPKGADEGEYRVTARVSSDDINQSDSVARSFRVIYARNDRGQIHLAQVTPY
ncbi:MAG: YMGG-like glycine zipper-containing protein [Syntrophotaleaceae bacterium]